MAAIDKKFEIMDNQSCVAAASTWIPSDYVIDLGTHSDAWGQSITPDIGELGHLWLNTNVSSTFVCTNIGAPLFTFKLYTHTTTTTAAGTLLHSQAVNLNATVGTNVTRFKLPAGTVSRYLGAGVLIGSVATTGGALDCWVSLDSESALPVT